MTRLDSCWKSRGESYLIDTLKNDKNPLEICSIMCELTKRESHSSAAREILRELSKLQVVFWNNYLVSDFALAALDLLKWEPYSEDREEVKGLIETKLNFE